MPTASSLPVEAAPANGTDAGKPLTTPVAEKLGMLDEARLSALIRKSMLDEPAQESPKPAEAKAEENTEETTSEEAPPTAEANEDTNALSQENTDQTTEESETVQETEQQEVSQDEGLPKGFQKRIDKLTALRREAEAKAKELEARIEDMQRKLQEKPEAYEAPARPIPGNPYLHLQTQAEVDNAIAEAKQVRRWCLMNKDGGVVKDANGQEVEYTAEKVREIQINIMDALEDYLPAQQKYIQTRQQIEPQAESEYSWWKDRTSKEYSAAKNFLELLPELKRYPDYKMVIGDYIRGASERQSKYEKQKTAAAKPAVKKAPTQPTRSVSAPPSVTGKDRTVMEAESKFRKAPTQDTLKNLISSKFL